MQCLQRGKGVLTPFDGMMINFQSSSPDRKTELHNNVKDKHMQGSRNVLDCFASTRKLCCYKLGREKANRSLSKVATYSSKKTLKPIKNRIYPKQC